MVADVDEEVEHILCHRHYYTAAVYKMNWKLTA